MSRTIVDDDLQAWDVFASGGPFGLPQKPKIVFHCVSDPERRARYVHHDGDNSTAQKAVREHSNGDLREILRESVELE